jgi:hypothetical protein
MTFIELHYGILFVDLNFVLKHINVCPPYYTIRNNGFISMSTVGRATGYGLDKRGRSWDPKKTKLNYVAFSPQANYTDRATAACRRS